MAKLQKDKENKFTSISTARSRFNLIYVLGTQIYNKNLLRYTQKF